MIVRITFDKDHVMLFGDSYKKWHQQLRIYIFEFKIFDYKKIECSTNKWPSYGGLKWCSAENFRSELKKANSNMEKITFKPAPDYLIKKIRKIFHDALRS